MLFLRRAKFPPSGPRVSGSYFSRDSTIQILRKILFKSLNIKRILLSREAATVGRTTWLRAEWSGTRISVGARDFSLLQHRWDPEFFPGYSDRGVNLTAQLNLEPRFRMTGATPVFPYMSSCLGQGEVYFLTLRTL